MTGGAAEGTARRPRPLGWSQQLLLAGQTLHPDRPLYNMALAFRIRGALDLDRFDRAFQWVSDHCESLRTTFVDTDDGPRRVVLPPEEVRSERRTVDAADLDAVLSARSQRILDPGSRLWDSVLYSVAGEDVLWFFNLHHLITDAWSSALLYDAVQDAYRRVGEGTLADADPLPSFEEYLAYEARLRGTDRHREARAHWAEEARKARPVHLFGEEGGARTTATVRSSHALGVERSERIRQMASRPDVRGLSADMGRFHLFMTALVGTLFRVSGQSRISVATPSHNRLTARLRQVPGLLIEVFPSTVDVESGATFADVLAAVRRTTSASLRHAQPGTSSPDANRVCRVVLNYIRASFPAFAGVPTTTQWVHPGHGDQEHDLRVQVHDFDGTGEFVLHLDMNQDRFDQDQRAALARYLVTMLDHALEDLDQPVTAPRLVDPALDARRARAGAGPDALPEGSVADAFREAVQRHGSRRALEAGGRAWTFAELDALSDRLATWLSERADGGAAAIGTGRSPEAVVAMLAALKGGTPFVPVDLRQPPGPLEAVLDEAGVTVLLVRQGQHPAGGVTRAVKIVDLEARPGASAPPSSPRPDDTAYVLYTSGSTGRPKGVRIPHRALDQYARWAAATYGSDGPWVMPLFTPLTFDLTLTSVFAPLLGGGTVRVIPEDDDEVDTALLRAVEGPGVDVLKLTPAHLRVLRGRSLEHLGVHTLIVGGEDLPTALARGARESFGRPVLYNEYGPTETTVGCTVHRFDPEVDVDGSVPIGRPVQGARVAVLDSQLQPQPLGVVGEIVVGGAGVALGYVSRPDETGARFLPDPDAPGRRLYRTGDFGRVRRDGTLEYRGRRDRQVKIHGVRVELDGLEALLAGHPDVRAAAVALRDAPVTLRPADVRHCARCGLPSTHPDAHLDGEDVCAVCRRFEAVRPRVHEYFESLDALTRMLRHPDLPADRPFDCLLMLSGGKDSSYALYRLVEMGASVTTLTLDNGYISEEAKANVRRITRALDVPHEFVTHARMPEVFAASLRRHANVCNGCFKTMYTVAFNRALEAGIPYVVTGLSRGQFFETRLTEELFQIEDARPERIDAMVLEARKAYHRTDDDVNRLLDTARLQNDDAFERVRFLDFYRYCDASLEEMYAFLETRAPWIRPSDTGRSTNCLINEAGIHVHTLERGYHNYALPYSWDVRLGHKTREAALEELDDEIDRVAVRRMLREVGYPDPADVLSAERQRVVAWVASDAPPDPDALRAWMAARIPAALVPTRFVPVEDLPLTRHGKVDRDALPDPDTARPRLAHAYEAPRSDAERRLADVWAHALGLDRVGVHDNFFDLGGDSITAIRIGSGAADGGLRLDPNLIFRHQTVAELARHLDHGLAADPRSTVEPARRKDVDPEQRSRALDLLRRADADD